MASDLSVVLTANLTASGRPVYWTESQSWSDKLTEALIVTDAERAEALLSQAKQQEAIVCDPYTFQVRVEGGHASAITAREKIRSLGPTVGLARA